MQLHERIGEGGKRHYQSSKILRKQQSLEVTWVEEGTGDGCSTVFILSWSLKVICEQHHFSQSFFKPSSLAPFVWLPCKINNKNKFLLDFVEFQDHLFWKGQNSAGERQVRSFNFFVLLLLCRSAAAKRCVSLVSDIREIESFLLCLSLHLSNLFYWLCCLIVQFQEGMK